MERFSVRDIQYTKLIDGYMIVVTTDVPCHLYMRWTTKQPWIHDKPVLRRGIFMHGDRYFCFVVYTDNEQEEAGDTLAHTFIKRGWPVCETRYFYFTGTIAGIPSPSTTAIFEKHFGIIKKYYLSTFSGRTVYQTNVNWTLCHDNPTGWRIANPGAPNYWTEAGDALTASYWIYRAFLFIDTTLLPADAKIAGAILQLYAKVVTIDDIARPNLIITQGVQNDPVTLLNYGDQLPYITNGGHIDLRTIVLNQYNDIHFNASGLPWIVRGGETRLCLRGQRDVEDYGTIVVSRNSLAYHTPQMGAPYEPRLIVYYQLP